jgi:hypothetical protein
MSQTLFERARALQASGHHADRIQALLVEEGHAAADVSVILGSLGEGPQPRPDPTADSAPLTLVTRVARSRITLTLFGLAFTTVFGGLVWLASLVLAAFGQSR